MGALEGKVAVVTGAGRGVGRAAAMAFATEGAAVALAARSLSEIEHVAGEVRTRGGRALAVATNVARREDVDTLFGRVSDELGPVDILVNNAAVMGPLGMLWETDPEAWRELFDVNVIGMVRCARAALPGMIARRYGRIINVGSNAGRSHSWAGEPPEILAYGASKAAVIRFSSGLAEQVKSYGVNVNCIGVGAHTRLSDETWQTVARLRGEPAPPTLDEVPVEECILPEENAALFVFLASPSSDHITGQYVEANSLPDRLRRRNP